FHKPPIGRIGSGEDLSVMPYNYWSPFHSVGYAVHQGKIIYRNADSVIGYLKGFDWLGLGVVSVIFGYAFGTPWRKALQEDRWRWLLIPTVCLTVVYLPVYADQRRYYWPTFPFLVAASFGFTLSVAGFRSRKRQVNRITALALVTLSFLIVNET